MSEGQSKRRIGSGMKPRGNKRFKPQKETKEMSNQSTDEGQQVVASEAVLDPQQGNETPGNLEPGNGEKGLQNLEEKGPMVAHDDGLEAALEESAGEVIDAEFKDVDEPLPPCDGKPMGKELAGITADKKYAIGVDYGKDKGALAVVKIGKKGKPDELVGTWEAIGLGPQPDGSTKVVVTIEEGYWEAVQQWAEADGVPVERWLSDRLYEYVSTYGEPAKGR